MLYIVPTPIGNLEDITFRAIRVLKEVDLILAEDTRVSGKLLQQYGIETKMKSFHAHNEHRKLEEVIAMLQKGMHLALISDAGTPGISDPGFLIVHECVKQGVAVQCLPGPTAFVPALVQSGLPCDRFFFEGFLPRKKGRQTRFKTLSSLECTIIIYESPFRIVKTLKDILEFMGNRQISVSRELSKKFEQTIRGTVSEVSHYFENNPPKGEFVLCIGKE